MLGPVSRFVGEFHKPGQARRTAFRFGCVSGFDRSRNCRRLTKRHVNLELFVEITPSSSDPVLPKKLPKTVLENAHPYPALPKQALPTLPVTPRLVLRHLHKAELARLSYHGAQSLKHQFQSNSFCEFGSLDQKQFAGFGILDDDGCAVIVFRGTVLTSWHNWAADFEVGWVEDPPRHQGFQRAWLAMAPEVHAWLALHHPRQIALTGHSLGGAIAIIAAFYLSNAWAINEVVTFGCPRVGSDDFANAYSNARSASDDPTVGLGAITTRYVKSSDLVAHQLDTSGDTRPCPLLRRYRLDVSCPARMDGIGVGNRCGLAG
jgi:hypothetical protein